MSGGRALIMAGGKGISSNKINTIETKVSKNTILSALNEENKNGYNKNLIDEINNEEEKFFSVWGYSEEDNNLNGNPPKEGDIVFITYKMAAIYFGTIFKIFESQELNSIWLGMTSWKYKILIKDVFRIFIPEPLNQYNKDLESLCKDNIFSPSISQLMHVKNCYENNFGLRSIIEKTDSKGNFQGSQYAEIDKEKVLENLSRYCLNSHFECIVKEL